MKSLTKIWTIGTSNRSLEDFLSLLKHHSIKAVADIRRFPTSKFPHFRKENLKDALESSGMKYFHIESLGGYRGDYLEHMRSMEFEEGMKELTSISSRYKTAFVCAELLFFRCHRRFVSDELVRRGFEVIHIIDKERTYKHKGKTLKHLGDP